MAHPNGPNLRPVRPEQNASADWSDINPSRRAFLGSLGIAASSLAMAAEPREPGNAKPEPLTYETQAQGIRILPGQWRPHYPWEHIVWVSPSWPSQDYIWLDFPEAIFTSQGLLYLSHINPPIPTVFSNLPKIPWQSIPGGIAFERTLPNGVAFGGSVVQESDSLVALELHIKNGSQEELGDITLQTCAYLRAIAEYGDYTRDNKFVHVPDRGWITLNEAMELPEGTAPYRVGWRTKGKRVLDVPMVVTVSNKPDRLFAFTWGKDTLSMVGNPHHPCVHADPQFADLAPGATGAVHGKLVFFEGRLDDFDYAAYL